MCHDDAKYCYIGDYLRDNSIQNDDAKVCFVSAYFSNDNVQNDDESRCFGSAPCYCPYPGSVYKLTPNRLDIPEISH